MNRSVPSQHRVFASPAEIRRVESDTLIARTYLLRNHNALERQAHARDFVLLHAVASVPIRREHLARAQRAVGVRRASRFAAGCARSISRVVYRAAGFIRQRHW
jgi:hypothetical protein